jgi:hypothetical protein
VNAVFPAANSLYSAANPTGESVDHGMGSEVSALAAEYGASGATPPLITPRQNLDFDEKWLGYAGFVRLAAE